MMQTGRHVRLILAEHQSLPIAAMPLARNSKRKRLSVPHKTSAAPSRSEQEPTVTGNLVSHSKCRRLADVQAFLAVPRENGPSSACREGLVRARLHPLHQRFGLCRGMPGALGAARAAGLLSAGGMGRRRRRLIAAPPRTSTASFRAMASPGRLRQHSVASDARSCGRNGPPSDARRPPPHGLGSRPPSRPLGSLKPG